ncbi:MAG: hypothetical protein E7127_06705 [Rikenellaceae bacterium]|nr:hypothetical protein [Rikenellaceae bacterium]
MDNRLLSELCERYFAGTTSLDDERVLRQALSCLDADMLSAEMLAVKAMMEMSAVSEQERVSVRLRHTVTPSWRLRVAVAVALLAIILIPIYKLSQPTVYGYYNGEPITSLAEAEARAQDIFNNLAQAELPQVNTIESLFELN